MRIFYEEWSELDAEIIDYNSSIQTDELEKGKSAMMSHELISPMPSDKFITPADKLLSHLSFSHLVEILTVDDLLARFFYETECIKCYWSVKELRRQISTNLYFRADFFAYMNIFS